MPLVTSHWAVFSNTHFPRDGAAEEVKDDLVPFLGIHGRDRDSLLIVVVLHHMVCCTKHPQCFQLCFQNYDEYVPASVDYMIRLTYILQK